MTFTFNAPSVTVYSNGFDYYTPAASAALRTALARGCRLDSRYIKRLINSGAGPANGITIEFEDGPNVTLGMLVHKPPTINQAEDLIRNFGLNTTPAASGGEITVDTLFGETNLRGCFAAGDTAHAIKQNTTAIVAGVRAAAGLSAQLCTEEGQRALEPAQSRVKHQSCQEGNV